MAFWIKLKNSWIIWSWCKVLRGDVSVKEFSVIQVIPFKIGEFVVVLRIPMPKPSVNCRFNWGRYKRSFNLSLISITSINESVEVYNIQGTNEDVAIE